MVVTAAVTVGSVVLANGRIVRDVCDRPKGDGGTAGRLGDGGPNRGSFGTVRTVDTNHAGPFIGNPCLRRSAPGLDDSDGMTRDQISVLNCGCDLAAGIQNHDVGHCPPQKVRIASAGIDGRGRHLGEAGCGRRQETAVDVLKRPAQQ
jgi:hypothetical protein